MGSLARSIMLKYQLTLRCLAMSGALAALLGGAAAQALADEQSALAELKSIREAADHADIVAQRRLAMVRASLPEDASELLRREVASTEEHLRACTPQRDIPDAAGAQRPANAPAFGQAVPGTASRPPGLDRVDRVYRQRTQESRPSDPEMPAERLRLLATMLAAALAATAAVSVFMMYRRAIEKNADKNEQLKQLNRELEEHTRRDSLTGLHNRRAFIDKMAARADAHQGSADGSGATDCITLMNIDRFRQINERFGPEVGDAILAEIGRRLHRVVRDTDMLLRWSGEEFMVFSPNAHPLQMERMLERVMGAVGSTPVQAHGHAVPVTISAGLACLPFSEIPEDDFNWQKVVNLADKALHYAKQKGRNRAIAVVTLRASEKAGLTTLETRFAEAVAEGLVEIMDVPGPAAARVELAKA